MNKIIKGCIIGFIATVIMDIANIVIASTGIINKGDIKQVGVFAQTLLTNLGVDSTSILTTQGALAAEGIIVHLLTGLIYGCVFIIVLHTLFERHLLNNGQTMVFSLIFGLFTLLAPFLIFQPVLGLGYFASESPNMMKIILTSITSHSIFGIGLWIGYLLCSQLPFFKRLKNSPA